MKHAIDSLKGNQGLLNKPSYFKKLKGVPFNSKSTGNSKMDIETFDELRKVKRELPVKEEIQKLMILGVLLVIVCCVVWFFIL